jgi:phenylpropionate dioxygenase-like ring-hydroxylating dioxygenase large terminal subunit
MNSRTTSLEQDGGVGDALERGLTLPASWYTDEAIVGLERDRIFRRTWQYAGPLDHARKPGDYFTLVTGGVPIVVLRDHDSELRAFANVCCHRGSVIVEGSGNRKSLQCPYHAWTYGLDGSLIAAPRSERERAFDKGRFSLCSLQVEPFGPLVFVNPDPESEPLSRTLGELPRIIEETGIDLARLEFRRRCEYVIETNWKVAVENTLECYHCPVAHPSFADLIDLDDYHLEEFEHFSVQGGPVRKSAVREESAQSPYDARGEVTQGLYCFLWPNLMLNVSPGPGNFHTNWTLPDGPHRSRMINDFFFVDSVGQSDGDDYVAFEDQVMREDIALVESVQAGLRSEVLSHGTLMLESEHALHHFQKLVHGALTGERSA